MLKPLPPLLPLRVTPTMARRPDSPRSPLHLLLLLRLAVPLLLLVLRPAAHEGLRAAERGAVRGDHGAEPRVGEQLEGRRAVLRVVGQQAAHEIFRLGGDVSESLGGVGWGQT